MSDILILAAHPDLAASTVTHSLLSAARLLPKVAVRDLYHLYPDYLIDVPAEQAALAEARLIVLLHPMHWWSMPALQKLWVDEVLCFGWAYGPAGSPTALAGKDLWLVTSAGSSASFHAEDKVAPIDALQLPYAQMARLCGMRYLPPRVLFDAHRISAPELQRQTQTFVQQLSSWPSWAQGAAPAPLVLQMDDRPPLFSALDGSE